MYMHAGCFTSKSCRQPQLWYSAISSGSGISGWPLYTWLHQVTPPPPLPATMVANQINQIMTSSSETDRDFTRTDIYSLLRKIATTLGIVALTATIAVKPPPPPPFFPSSIVWTLLSYSVPDQTACDWSDWSVWNRLVSAGREGQFTQEVSTTE